MGALSSDQQEAAIILIGWSGFWPSWESEASAAGGSKPVAVAVHC